MLVTTRSRVESKGLVKCGLALVTLKFCELGLATKELGLLKMADFTTLGFIPEKLLALCKKFQIPALQ